MNSTLFVLIDLPYVPMSVFLVLWSAARWFLDPEDRKRSEWMLVVSALSAPAATLAERFAETLSVIRPQKYDEFIFRIDSLLGQPSYAIGKFAAHHPSVTILLSVVYGSLPIVMVWVFGIYLWRRQTDCVRVIYTFGLNLFAAIPLYLLFPVCGPRFAFKGFPFAQPNVDIPHTIAVSAAPNGIPSVHTSTALLAVFLLWPWRLQWVLAVIFLILTLLSTLGSGQHYFFDLVCALPYAILVYWAGAKIAHHTKDTSDDSSGRRKKEVATEGM